MKNRWKLTKINQGYEMTKIGKDGIICRKLNWFEKIIYWLKVHNK
jgi:hypothetical protein